MCSLIRHYLIFITLFSGFRFSETNRGKANNDFGLEEVVVTAQKREQSLQETPIAISVLQEKQL